MKPRKRSVQEEKGQACCALEVGAGPLFMDPQTLNNGPACTCTARTHLHVHSSNQSVCTQLVQLRMVPLALKASFTPRQELHGLPFQKGFMLNVLTALSTELRRGFE